jgi:hypothetical protein
MDNNSEIEGLCASGSSSGVNRQSTVNWQRCIICQKDGNEQLQCPADSKRSDLGAGYQLFADILPKFRAIGALPPRMDIADFDEGSGICATLYEHKAKWHKTCRLIFYPRELDRIAARKSREANTGLGQHETKTPVDVSPRKRRRTQPLTVKDSKVRLCFFVTSLTVMLNHCVK